MKQMLMAIVVIAAPLGCRALTNPGFDTNGAGWNIYPNASAVTFSGGQAHLVKPVSDGIAIWQDETAFTSGSYKATFVVVNVTGTFAVGWQHPTTSAWAPGSPTLVSTAGTYMVTCNDPALKTVDAGEVNVSTQFTADIDSISTSAVLPAAATDWQLFN
ncbi:MAG: hypothetical protein ACR2IE_16310 [Candidatus Sumerlaeaceae bacterium]